MCVCVFQAGGRGREGGKIKSPVRQEKIFLLCGEKKFLHLHSLPCLPIFPFLTNRCIYIYTHVDIAHGHMDLDILESNCISTKTKKNFEMVF